MPVGCCRKWVFLYRSILGQYGYVLCVKRKKVSERQTPLAWCLCAVPFSFPHATALHVPVLNRDVVLRCQAMIARHDDDKWRTDEDSIVHVMHLPFGTR